MLILEAELPGAVPASVATQTPLVGEILQLIGYGIPAIASFTSWGYLDATGDIIGGRAPVNTIDSVTIKTRFAINSSTPLIFNGTPGHSGGGVFNSQRQLCGTMTNASIPSTSANTYSVNLTSAFNRTWIQDVSTPYDPSPELSIELAGTAMRLTWNAASAGYRLQTSDDLGSAGWTNLGPVITAPGTYDDPIASRPRQFYRLFKP